jgi:hypothetical protein
LASRRSTDGTELPFASWADDNQLEDKALDIEQDNERESGARKLAAVDSEAKAKSHDVALPKQDKPYGLTETLDDTQDKTRQSEGTNPSHATPSPATQKGSGAGPAIAEHSKDAKTPSGGRQPGAYVKE